MSFFSALYRLLIGPLELFFEILFSLANRIIQNPGLSIIFLSLAMNFLVLPLYRRADAMQEEERETNKRLRHWTTHIKKTFKGDERFMILQTYYRQNNYKPTDALKGSVSLLLEIPFFIAAYNFLSGLPLLHGAALGPIADLGAPDGLLVLGGVAINVLPILMTGINLVSSAIYTKGLPIKSKVQLYVMAALFLVLLYDSPAGLVFYWTLNNLFSLVKNVFYKLKNPRLTLCILSTAAGAAALIGLFLHPLGSVRTQIILAILLLLLQLPLLFYLFRQNHPLKEVETVSTTDQAIFWIGGLLMTILTGLLIPSALLHSSPEEFINIYNLSSPMWYVMNSLLLAAGTFLVWGGIFYMLASPAGKRVFSILMAVAGGLSLVDYLFFGKDYGTLASNLVYINSPVFSTRAQLLNLSILTVCSVGFILIRYKKAALIKFILSIVSIALVIMSAVNLFGTYSVSSAKLAQLTQEKEHQPTIPLSRTGKNVIVLMMDRAINCYIPCIMNEKPELKEQFAGFTYYPNTISYGGFTNFGAPGLYGGYEYIPTEMNKRDQESLESKHNEAMKVLPVLFDQAGYSTTVCDPTYAGYQWIPDISIYDEYPGIRAFNTGGHFFGNVQELGQDFDATMNRNLFCYSLFKVFPVFVQPTFYQNGAYCSNTAGMQEGQEGADSQRLNTPFMKPFNVLCNLGNMTELSDSETGTFLMMSNDTTHEPMLLQEPEYLPSEVVDNREYDAAHADRFTLNGRTLNMETEQQIIHYHANMASMIQLGRWFDQLRALGVYDNTRIILVSDHATGLGQYEDLFRIDGIQEDLMRYNPLLMVKDFNSRKFTADMTFMTNADTPVLALQDLVDNPINPFTGKPINSLPKSDGEQVIFTSMLWDVNVNNGNTFLPDGWISVHDNIFEAENWRQIAPNIPR